MVGGGSGSLEGREGLVSYNLQHLLDQLFTGGMFQQRVPALGFFPRKPAASAASTKEKKWGQYRDGVVQRLAVLLADGRTMVYTDGSAQQVWGWWQAGYGAWFGDAEKHSTGLLVPVMERQSVSRGELRGVSRGELRRVLYALEWRRAAEKMVIVLDSEYVYKGITEWSPRWQRHGWRVKSREVGHRDLWEANFLPPPSHM